MTVTSIAVVITPGQIRLGELHAHIPPRVAAVAMRRATRRWCHGAPERPELQIDHDKAAKRAMEEEKIDAAPSVADAETPLSSYEREIAAELEEKVFEVPDERIFELRLRVFVAQAEELQNERILQLVLRRECIGGPTAIALGGHRGLVLRKGGALVELRLDLPLSNEDFGSSGTGWRSPRKVERSRP